MGVTAVQNMANRGLIFLAEERELWLGEMYQGGRARKLRGTVDFTISTKFTTC